MSRTYGHSPDSHFTEIASANIKRSSFNRSHGTKMTCDAGLIIPIFVDEVLPGDTFNLRLTALGRLATPIYPIMDNVRIFTHFFFVPNRLVWEHWEAFNGAQKDPSDKTDYVIPTIKLSPEVGDLSDYYGLPLQTKSYKVTGLPFRGHNLIYNEYFRDENLEVGRHVETGDGPDSFSWYDVMRSRKVKDYFTSCLPWPQKGTASYINDIGDLSVQSSAEYPKDAPFQYSGPDGTIGEFGSTKNDWNVKFSGAPTHGERISHRDNNHADGLIITST